MDHGHKQRGSLSIVREEPVKSSVAHSPYTEERDFQKDICFQGGGVRGGRHSAAVEVEFWMACSNSGPRGPEKELTTNNRRLTCIILMRPKIMDL